MNTPPQVLEAVGALLPVRLAFLREMGDFAHVRETGGDNRGPAVEFLQKLGEIRPGQPWCAALVNACGEIACAKLGLWSPLEGVHLDGDPNDLEGYVQAYYEHSRREGWLVERPRIGDLFMVYHGHLDRHAHIGAVASVYDKGIGTIEGNSNDDGSRNGIGTFQLMRSWSQRIVFADPWAQFED